MSGQPQRRVKGISISRQIVYGNTAVFVVPSERHNPDHSHRWTVAVRSAASPPPGKRGEVQQIGGYDDISYFIRKVQFKLHESYPNSTRIIEKPPFEMTETGWGEFELQIRIYFTQETGEKVLTFNHLLKLHPWTIDPATGVSVAMMNPKTGVPMSISELEVPAVHSWQFDEIVFPEPTEAFYNLAIANPPTPLPKTPRIPHHGIVAPISVHNGGLLGEFCGETEEKEGQKIVAAKDGLLTELEAVKARVKAFEDEIKQLKADIEKASGA